MPPAFPELEARVESCFATCREKFGAGNRAWAFIAMMGEDGSPTLGVAQLGNSDYAPLPLRFGSCEDAAARADGLNARLGLSGEDVARIVVSSLAGPDRSTEA